MDHLRVVTDENDLYDLDLKSSENLSLDGRRIVLLPFTGTIADQTVFAYYLEKIVQQTDEIILTHIIKPKVFTVRSGWKIQQRKLFSSVSPFIEECKRRNLHYQSIFHTGNVGQGLCELMAEHRPDLVLIGSPGSTKFHRKLQTSVSEYVMRNSDTPVLVVPFKY